MILFAEKSDCINPFGKFNWDKVYSALDKSTMEKEASYKFFGLTFADIYWDFKYPPTPPTKGKFIEDNSYCWLDKSVTEKEASYNCLTVIPAAEKSVW